MFELSSLVGLTIPEALGIVASLGYCIRILTRDGELEALPGIPDQNDKRINVHLVDEKITSNIAIG